MRKATTTATTNLQNQKASGRCLRVATCFLFPFHPLPSTIPLSTFSIRLPTLMANVFHSSPPSSILFQVCRVLYNVCSCDTLWKRLYVNHFVEIPPEIHSVAEDLGWKKAFLMNAKILHGANATKKSHIKQYEEHINGSVKENQKVTFVI